MRRALFVTYFLLSFSVFAQKDCASIASSSEYFSASAMALNEQEARANALSLLLSQISALVSTRTELQTKEDSKFFEQVFTEINRSVSQLRLNGLNYLSCARSRRDEGYTVIAYIRKDDLKQSAEEVAKQVRQYMELMEQKRNIEIDYIAEAYTAYLYTFYTPYAISYKLGSEDIANVQSYLESLLRNYLSTIKIKCLSVLESPSYPDDQLLFELKIEGGTDSQLKYYFDCPAYNAKAELAFNGGRMEVIMQPIALIEQFKGRLIIKPLLLPSDLREIDNIIEVTKEVSFEADMSHVIKIDFDILDYGNDWGFLPSFRHLSIRQIEWYSNNKRISTEQRPRIPKKEVGHEITLKINRSEDLSLTKKIEKSDASVLTLKVDQEPPYLTVSPVDLNGLNNFDQLQTLLSKLKNEGKAVVGRKSDFFKPDNCWVFLIHAETKEIIHVLSPNSAGRNDLKSGKNIIDFENDLKGLVAVWVEFY